MAERDYPEGHPAASDYQGQAYRGPRAPWAEDYDLDHAARGGDNTSDLDTPDGMRAHQLANEKQVRDKCSVDILPHERGGGFGGQGAKAAREAEALEYLKCRGYEEAHAKSILGKHGADEILADKAKQAANKAG